jgi:hypothetical protein
MKKLYRIVSAGRDWNLTHPENKRKALPLEQTCSFAIFSRYYYNDDTSEDTVVGERICCK